MAIAELPGGIPSAPTSTDNATVILWVVAVLMGALGIALVLLKRKLDENEAECRKQNDLARAEAAAARAQNERLYEEAIKATASRETKLVEVVERNTAAWNAFREEVGSGHYRALREANQKANRDPTDPR